MTLDESDANVILILIDNELSRNKDTRAKSFGDDMPYEFIEQLDKQRETLQELRNKIERTYY